MGPNDQLCIGTQVQTIPEGGADLFHSNKLADYTVVATVLSHYNRKWNYHVHSEKIIFSIAHIKTTNKDVMTYTKGGHVCTKFTVLFSLA